MSTRKPKLSFKQAVDKCADIKAMQKVQDAFRKATVCKTWEEAEEKYPLYTTAKKLEPFKRLNYSGSKIPEQLMKFCLQAKQPRQTRTEEQIEGP